MFFLIRIIIIITIMISGGPAPQVRAGAHGLPRGAQHDEDTIQLIILLLITMIILLIIIILTTT